MALFTVSNAAKLVSIVRLATEVKTSKACAVATVVTNLAVMHTASQENVSEKAALACLVAASAVSIWRCASTTKNRSLKKEMFVGMQNLALISAGTYADKLLVEAKAIHSKSST